MFSQATELKEALFFFISGELMMEVLIIVRQQCFIFNFVIIGPLIMFSWLPILQRNMFTEQSIYCVYAADAGSV